MKFSIITPTFNRSASIGRSIESVIAQTYPNWELIIVDDGSTDNTADIVRSYNDSRIKYHYIKNSGANFARNTGAEMAGGEFIIFLDSDDILHNDRLEKDNIILSQNNVDLLVSRANLSANNVNTSFDIQAESNLVKAFIEKKIRWSILAVTWNRPFFFTVGGFDNNLKCGQDWDIHLRAILKQPNVHFNNEILSTCFVDETAGDRIASVKSKKSAIKYFNNIFDSRIKFINIIPDKAYYRSYLKKYFFKTALNLARLSFKDSVNFFLKHFKRVF